MRIGYMIGEGTGEPPDLGATVERGRRIEELGLDTAWIAQIQLDAQTAATALGMVTERVEIGTAVVPTLTRHPFAMGCQAVATQQACGGRFTLGIGLSHKVMAENVLGMGFDRPVAQMREYLEVLAQMLQGKDADFAGELYTTRFAALPVGTPVSVLVAALGPQMLRLTGRLADGTIAWACGPRTLGEHIVPTLTKAAADAGRSAPRVVAGFPVAVTSDVDAAREAAARTFGHYKMLPSYKAMLDREGVAGVEDLIVAGEETAVREQLAGIEGAGTTDLCAFPFEVDPGSIDRTLELLGDVARAGR